MRSRSPSGRPAAAAWISSRTWSVCTAAVRSTVSAAGSPAAESAVRRAPPAPLPQALVPRDRVQPGAQPVRVAKLPDPRAGQHERVVDGVGGRVAVTEQRSAVRPELVGVAPVRAFQAARVPGEHRGDDRPVVHGRHGRP